MLRPWTASERSALVAVLKKHHVIKPVPAPAQPAPITPEQLLALAQTTSLDLDKVIKVFKMAAPVQDPVAWCTKSDLKDVAKGFSQAVPARSMRVPQLYPKEDTVLLYTTPPAAQRPWVGLTDEDRQIILDNTHPYNRWTLAERIEAKLKEKNQ
jgi:hypothetical protein